MNNTGTNSVWQPILEDENVLLRPLQQSDFEELYKVASDPLIWEQHPNPDRYKREVFQNYFSGAMESGGAFAVYDARSGELMGSTRFYDYDASEKSFDWLYVYRTQILGWSVQSGDEETNDGLCVPVC